MKINDIESLTHILCVGRGRRRKVGRWRGIYGKQMGRDGIDKGG
jgi:hypothetical protein